MNKFWNREKARLAQGAVHSVMASAISSLHTRHMIAKFGFVWLLGHHALDAVHSHYVLPMTSRWVARFSGTPKVVRTELLDLLEQAEAAIRSAPLTLSVAYVLHGRPGVGKSYAAIQRSFSPVTMRAILGADSPDGDTPCGGGGTCNRILIDEVDKMIEADPKFLRSLLAYLDKMRDDKCIVVMTTNFPEKLPEALVRPGRVSKIIEVTPWGREKAAEFCRLYEIPLEEAPVRDDGYYVGDLIEWARGIKLKELMEAL